MINPIFIHSIAETRLPSQTIRNVHSLSYWVFLNKLRSLCLCIRSITCSSQPPFLSYQATRLWQELAILPRPGVFFFFLTLKIFSKQDWPVDGLSLTYSPSCKVQAQLSLICQRGLTCISSSLHLPHLFCNAPSHNQAVHTKLFCTSSKGRPIFIFILLFFLPVSPLPIHFVYDQTLLLLHM